MPDRSTAAQLTDAFRARLRRPAAMSAQGGWPVQITFPHQIEYATKVNLTLSDIAHAILSHEELIKPVAAILEDVVPGLKVSKIEIRLTRAENGSLREEFLVSLW